MKDRMTIFYTDDDTEDLEFFREATDALDLDLNLVTLDNGSKLLDAIENPPPSPHMLFLDLNMPGLSGFDVLKILRQKNNLLPIVIFSTSKDEEHIRRSLALGANYYVPKSTRFDSLRKSIEHAIRIDWNKFKPTPQNFLYSS